MSGFGERDCIFEGVLEVDIAGGREVELIGVCELHVLGLIICVGCDIVQADHAPDGGVAQGIFHGILIRHRRNQEEVEVGLDEEEERETRGRGHSRTSAHVDDHGWNEDTQTRLEPM